MIYAVVIVWFVGVLPDSGIRTGRAIVPLYFDSVELCDLALPDVVRQFWSVFGERPNGPGWVGRTIAGCLNVTPKLGKRVGVGD